MVMMRPKAAAVSTMVPARRLSMFGRGMTKLLLEQPDGGI
jgi:hypothetical protein